MKRGLLVALVIGGMTTAASGLGFDFSPFWFLTISDQEIAQTLDQQPDMQLCNIWKKYADNKGLAGDKARLAIGSSLQRRGESPFLCQQMGFGN